MTLYDLPQGVAPGTIPLLLGHPDPATLMTPAFREAMQQFLVSPHASSALQYGPEQGTQGLMNAIIAKINRDQGLSLHSGNIMIVAGSTHAVDMLARLFAKPAGAVLVEAPTYADSLHIFRDHHLDLYAIPTDNDGLIPSALEQQLIQLHKNGITPSMLYTIPNFQNPTGTTLPESRRLEIIRLARQYGFLIVEDDVYRELSFENTVPASFYALATGKQAVSIGSFSKTLAPGLRLGWIVGSEEIIEQCVNCGTTQMGGGANPFTAHLIAQYCQSGAYEEHLLSLRSLYKMRRDIALSALARSMPAGVEWTHPLGGFFIWLTLPEQVFASRVKQQALQQGILVASGAGFYVNPRDGEHHLRLAYSCAQPQEIEAGIETLAQIIRQIMHEQTAS